MMYWHRLCAFGLGALLLYVVVTGAFIELADMRALVAHAPETDPDMLMMRQHIDGTPNYSVVSAPDYTAWALPQDLDVAAAIEKTAALGRAAAPASSLRLVELRMAGDQSAGHVRMDDRHLIFDLASERPLPASDLPPAPPGNHMFSLRSSFKYFHRFNYLGGWSTTLDGLAGIGIAVLIVTGIWQYAKLYAARRRLDKRSPLWRGADLWRDLHRWTAVVAGVIALWIALTGLALSIDNVGGFWRAATTPRPSGPNAFDGDFSSPLPDNELAPMTQTTLNAFHRAMPGVAMKVLQLRYYAGYAQGVVVAADRETTQLVFNARTGARMTMSEPGYPNENFPFGWDWHQRLKRMHRGDIFGMTGRWLDTFGALSLVYLTVSGLVMYLQLRARRRRLGRPGLIWE